MNKSIFLKITIALFAIIFSFNAKAQSPTLAWAKQMQDSAASVQIGYGYAVTLDANENVYTTGHFVGTHDFDPGVGVYKLSALVGGSSVFVSKLDSTGAFVWAKKIGGNGSSGRSIAIGNSGDVYITGHFSGISDMDPGPGVFNLSSIGFEDIFVMKLNSLGNFVWAKRIGDSGTDIGHSITIDASENLFITGSYAGSPDFDPGAGTTIMASNGSVDAFILKLDGSGNFVFSKNLGGTGNEFGYSVTLDGTGNIYTTGSFNSTSDFDPSAGTFNMTPSAFGGTDAFISKLNSLGNFVWAKKFGGSSTSFGYGIKIDNSGDVIIAGHFTGTVDFDPNAGTFNITSASSGASSSIFVSKLNASGNLVWAKGFGGSASCYALSVDIAGGIYTTGFFGTFSDFDPGVPTYYLNNINGRVFISKLDLNGNFSWANNIAGSTNAEGRGIIVDAIGNVFSTGTFENTGDFDPGAGSFTMSTSVTNNLNIYIQRLKGGACLAPSQPISISGSASICSGSSNTYSVSAVAGATSYTWSLPGGWSGTSTTNSISATASATSGNITVTANNACGNSSAQTLSVTVNTIPATPGTISGTTTICSGSSNTYSVSAVAGATSYTWSLPGGWSGTSTTNSISTTASATSGNITVTANNVCGNSSAQTLSVTVNTIPATPGTISGTTTICSGSSNTYSVSAVAGATSYTWSLPGGWSGTSTTNSISTTASATSGNITVTANNACGNSSAQTLSVTVNTIPATPGTISGTTTICSGSSNTYSVSAVAGATSYTWSLPGGWSGTSTTNSISTTASATSGNITVTANNACGNSSAQTLSVTVNTIPATPGTISGTTTICSGSSNTYSVSAVAGATSYTWSLPGGWSGTSTTNSISTTASATSGNITVTANNACGNSSAQTLSVTVNTIPATPGTISGLSSMCVGAGASTYSISSVVGATSYAWSLPIGWSGASTSNSISATPGSSGTISVTASNTCGTSAAQNLSVTINALPTIVYTQNPDTVCASAGNIALGSVTPLGGTFSGTAVTGTNFNATTAGAGTFTITYTYTDANSCTNTASQNILVDLCTGLSDQALTESNFIVFPNPANELVTITTNENKGQLIIYNTLGAVLYSQQLSASQTMVDISAYQSGIYFIQLQTVNGMATKKIIKQ